MNRTNNPRVEIVLDERIAEIVRRVLSHLSNENAMAVIEGWMAMKAERPSLKIVGAQTTDDVSAAADADNAIDVVAAAYLCEYPGQLGVIVGPWLKQGLQRLDTNGFDPGIEVIKELLEVAKSWEVDMVQCIRTQVESANRLLAVQNHDPLAARLRASGMTFLTTLQHMVLKLDDDSNHNSMASGNEPENFSSEPGSSRRWQQFDVSDLAKWIDWLDRTYVDTLDCPELNGVRNTASTLDGYAAMARSTQRFYFDGESANDNDFASRSAFATKVGLEWWGLFNERNSFACDDIKYGVSHEASSMDIEAGFLLSLTGVDVWELTYMGVSAQTRRKGLGKHCLAQAIKRVRDLGGKRLALAVDIRNTYCIKLYEENGFKPVSLLDAWIFRPSR